MAASARSGKGEEQQADGASPPFAAVTPPPAGCLDEESFRHFAPLLAASQAYAGRSGCRFRGASFDDLDSCEEAIGGSPSAAALGDLEAKLQAAPSVQGFAERLRLGEPALVEELDRAFRIVIAESYRNMMIATCKGLGLFPPLAAPDAVSEDDCSYEDVSAPLPCIGQRLYNDQVRRDYHDAHIATRGQRPGRLQRRAMTAAYLVDFAHCSGITLPPVPETYQEMLQEFSARTAEWSASIAKETGRKPPRILPSTAGLYCFGPRPHVRTQPAPARVEPRLGQAEQAVGAGWLERWQSTAQAVVGALVPVGGSPQGRPSRTCA